MSLSGLLVRGFGTLDQAAIQIRRYFTSSLMSRVFGALPHLYEGLLDRSAPGAGTQEVFGHDHGYRGGHNITRNLVFSADKGIGGTTQSPLYRMTTLTRDNDWYEIDEDESAPVKGQDWHWKGFVSPGVDSEKLATDGNAIGLEGWALFYGVPTRTGDVDFQIKNVTDNAAVRLPSSLGYSEAQTLSLVNGVSSWGCLHFTQIKCIPGIWNRWLMQYRTAGMSGQVDLVAILVTETHARSEPAYAGSSEIWNIPAESYSSYALPLVLSAWDRQTVAGSPKWVNQGTAIAGDYDPAGAGGGTDPSEIAGLPGYEFDGANDKLNDAKSPFSSDDAFTMAAWVRLDRVDVATDPQAIICVGIEAGGSTCAMLCVGWSQDGDVALQFGEDEGAVTNDGALVPINTWKHICVTKAHGDCTDGNTEIYVNGVSKALAATGNTPAVTNDSLTYGAYRNGFGYDFFADGEIAGVLIDVTEYSAADVLALFNRQKAMFGL